MDEFTKFRLQKLKERAQELQKQASTQEKDLGKMKLDVDKIKDKYGFNEPLLEDPMASEFDKFKNKKLSEAEKLERLKNLYYRDMPSVQKAETPSPEELNLDPKLSDLQKHKLTKEAQQSRQALQDLGIKLDYDSPIPPDSEIVDPRNVEYNKKIATEEYLPEGHNVDKWEKYWKDIGYNYGDKKPTWKEWDKAKQFELGTPEMPVVPSLVQLGLLLGAEKAASVPEAGAGSDVIPEEEKLSPRFKKIKQILENK